MVFTTYNTTGETMKKIKTNKQSYQSFFFFNILIISGFIIGLYLSKYITQLDQSNLNSYMSVLIDIDGYENYFVNQFMMQLFIVLLLLMLATTYIGMPIISFIIYTKGLQLGFSCALFMFTYGFKGILGIIIVFIPQMIFDLLAFYITSIYSLELSKYTFKCMKSNAVINFQKTMNKTLNILIVTIILVFLSSYFKASIGIECIRFFQNL